MKKKMKRFLATWIVGIFIGIIYLILVVTRRIKIYSYGRLLKLIIRKILKKEKRGVVLYFRHPSLYDPVTIPPLFLPFLLIFLALIPYSVTDEINYYNKKWFWFFRTFSISIDRQNRRKAAEILQTRIRKVLDDGGLIAFAAGGGREGKGTEWKLIKNGRIEIVNAWNENEKMIRRFQSGIAWLSLNTDSIFLPVWTEGGERIIPNIYDNNKTFPSLWQWRPWEQLIIKIGEQFKPEGTSKQEIIEALEDALLKLGEE